MATNFSSSTARTLPNRADTVSEPTFSISSHKRYRSDLPFLGKVHHLSFIVSGMYAAPDIADVGRTGHRYESWGERREINMLTRAKEASRLLEEENKQTFRITRHKEDLKLSESDRGVIALNTHAPIYQLSDDVLCHIFKLYCKDSLPLTFPVNHQVWGALPQITLLRVCLAWREIMLNVPTFWSSIKIVPKKLGTPRFFDSMVKAANAWLSRAKGLPCSIDIDFPEPVCAEYCELSDSLWEMDWNKNIIRDLISLHKFKRLGVTFAEHHLRELMQLPDDRLSCIEDLCLRYISLTKDETISLSEMNLHKFSNLTSFSLSPNPFNTSSLTYPPAESYFNLIDGIPMRNLRNIHLHGPMPTTYCLGTLEYSNRFGILETCSLVITGDDSDDDNDDANDDTITFSLPVHLFQLRELKVTVCSQSRKEEILEIFLVALRFPRLKSLALGSVDYGDMLIDPQMLLRVQEASQIHLEELIISDSTLPIDVRIFLTSFPSLRRLELPYKTTFTDEAMIEVGAGSIGVFLEDLTINNPRLNIEKLLQMVKARSHAGNGKHRNQGTGFKSVTLRCNKAEHEMEDKILSFIEEIKLLGVDLDVIFRFVPQRHYEEWEGFSDYSDVPDDEEIYSFF